MKKFFSVIPLQSKDKLDSYCYKAMENKRLAMEEKTAFPIMTVINGYLEPGETSQVIVVLTDIENVRRNYPRFLDELQQLCERKGLVQPEIKEIGRYARDESVNAQIDLFQKLIEYTEDGDELFACITYGDKPISMAVRWRRFSMPIVSCRIRRLTALYMVRSTAVQVPTGRFGRERSMMKRVWCGWMRLCA